MQQEGYKMHKWNSDGFPAVITLFSAPNYCGSYQNKAAVMILKNNGINLKCYGDSEAPYQLVDEINVFCWSIPFLAESVTSMLLLLLSKSKNYDIHEEKDSDEKME